ncbi:hypothetical protein HY638_06140, partial [Candidatus Woesearchaeota archaeon]|nr:hypothetical protein [Candidatus Woesearchaeota archaeon]
MGEYGHDSSYTVSVSPPTSQNCQSSNNPISWRWTYNGCAPESDSSFCSRYGKNCGSFTATDNCGNARTANCGSCTSPQSCGGGGTANVCGGGTIKCPNDAGVPYYNPGDMLSCGVCGTKTCRSDGTWPPCSDPCVSPTCSDSVQNQGEAGVDCGGPCPACTPGKCPNDAGVPYYNPGDMLPCGVCGTKTCRADGTWPPCTDPCTTSSGDCGNDREEPGEECDRGTRNGDCPAECSYECKWNRNCPPPQECSPNTWQSTSNGCGACGTEQRWCDNNGKWTSQYQCIGQGPCTPSQTQCSGSSYQSCNSGCNWQAAGTDNDGDGVDSQCGDSQCDNAYGVFDSTRQSPETSCADFLDNDCDGRRDCQDTDCAGRQGPGGVICCQIVSDCLQDDCVIESCVANNCQFTNRNSCDSTECASGRYCYNGDCTDGDNSEYVCLNCAPDTTIGRWDWSAKIFEDAGKAYSRNTNVFDRLFDSNEGSCPGTTCTKSAGCSCYDTLSTKTLIKRKRALTTGNCCGDDPNEWYKKDYYGGECVSSVDQCVWSDGHSQQANSGNKQWWCNPGNWHECNDNTIGQGSPNNPPPQGVCCAGTVGNSGWTPVSEILPENQYSCTDGKDNDCDGKIDCEDNDCDGTIKGTVKSD